MSAERGANDRRIYSLCSSSRSRIRDRQRSCIPNGSGGWLSVLGNQEVQGDDVLSLSVKKVGWVLDILKACKDESASLDKKNESTKNLHTRICSAHHILNQILEAEYKRRENSK